MQADALTPGLQQRAARLISGKDQTTAEQIASIGQNARGRTTALPIVEAGLQSPFAAVRATSASLLRSWPKSEALLAAFEHKDPDIRKAVAMTLGQHNVIVGPSPAGAESFASHKPVITGRERSILARLISDSDAEVRVEAFNSALQLDPPLSADIYKQLAADSDVRVRMLLLSAPQAPLTFKLQVAEEAARATDPNTLDQFDRFLAQFVRTDPSDEALLQLVPAIRARFVNSAKAAFGDTDSDSNSLYLRLSRSSAGLQALVIQASLKFDTRLLKVVNDRFKELIGDGSTNTDFGFRRRSIKPADLGS
jgi:hypothetical protein